ncbi:hypothetical protein ACIRBX_04850 [Kitasatospora sp. NPDC096147]|uniref:hypothetical protein n=1 Tax=Kitasatospora sp. NPDC096147 TaxID=3364093 RepID=UPI003817CBEA
MKGVGAGWWLAAAGFAAALAAVSTLAPHRIWGGCAAVGYLLAAGLVRAERRARGAVAAVAVAAVGAVLVPLVLLLTTGQAQSEVGVVERSAATLLRTGTPYLAEPQSVTDYNPYLPGMAVFGLPGRLAGAGDVRFWCAAALVLCLAAAHLVLRSGGAARPVGAGRGHGRVIGVGALVASPLVALPLCVSGVDLPLTGLLALALALAVRHRPVAAGVALAAACSLKWTALPALPVVLALLTAGQVGWNESARGGSARGGSARGGAAVRSAVRCLAAWAVGTTAVLAPVLVAGPGPLVEQVFRFPTGRGAFPTPAASPLPGRLLADLGPAGRWTGLVLLLCGGVAVAVSLVRRPPRGLVAAADRLAAGLCLAFLFAPAGRYGYFALPLLLVLWARLVARAAVPTAVRASADGSGRLAVALPGTRIRPSLT